MSQPYDRVFNFSAGPCTLPVEVLEEARDGLMNYQGSGMSVMDQYAPRFGGDRGPIRPDKPGDVLVVLTCQVKNGHRVKELINFQRMYTTDDHTALGQQPIRQMTADEAGRARNETFCLIHCHSDLLNTRKSRKPQPNWQFTLF